MSERFVVAERSPGVPGDTVYLVLDTNDKSRPVAQFADRAAAEAHAARLAAGPFDWDEQDAWRDDDWGRKA